MNLKYALALLIVPLLNTGCSGGFKALNEPFEMKMDSSSLQFASIKPSIISEAGGTVLTISGSGFSSEVVVTIGDGVCSSLNVLSSTQLTCVAPATKVGNQTLKIQLADGSVMAAPIAIAPASEISPDPVAPPSPTPPTTSEPPPAPAPTPSPTPTLPQTQSCSIPFGTGQQTLINGVYGPCIATSCQSGFRLENGKCNADPNDLQVEACPSTLPRGYATTIDIREFYINRVTVSDGTNIILDKDVTIPVNVELQVRPTSNTTYTVAGYKDGVKIIEKIVTIAVYDINDPIFVKSPTPLTFTRDSNDSSGYRLNWANPTIGLDFAKVSFKDAVGSEMIGTAYSPFKAATLNSWWVGPAIPTDYAVFACKGYGFKSELTEMATVRIVPPTPRLSPEPGQPADCLGIARYVKNGQYAYQRLFGGGNFNSTQEGATILSCTDYLQQQHQKCLEYFGTSCKTTGYLRVKDSQVNSASHLRIYSSDAPQAPTFPLATAGVCYNSYYTNSTQHPVVDSGNDYVVSTSQASLTEDCMNLNWFNAFEINALSADGSQITGTKRYYLVEVPSNTVLANKSYPRP